MNKLNFFNRRFTITIISYSVILIILGFLLDYGLKGMVEELVVMKLQKEVKDAADYYSEDLNNEINTLSNIANLLVDPRPVNKNKNIERSMELVDNVFYAEPRVIVGLMKANGDYVFGEDLSLYEYRGILNGMTGQKSVSYITSGGLLFAYPVFRGDNVRYVLYSICASNYIGEKHGAHVFKNSIGDVMIMTKNGDVIVPFSDISENQRPFYESASVKKTLLKLVSQSRRQSAAVSLEKTTLGEMFFYCSEIANTDFVLTGTISKEIAYGKISSISTIVLALYTIFVVIVLILSTYLYFISQQARESEELKIARDEAQAASKAKGDFLANMSHEIRTPINAVLGIDEMILREYDDKKIRQYAYNIKSAMVSLLNLINDILDYSRMEADKVTLINEPYDTSVMISDLMSMVGKYAEQKSLIFDVAVDKNIPKVLVGDVIRIKQIITNLLTNAFKYTEKGFVNLIIDYEKLDEKTIRMKVTVKDSGIGMKPEDIDKLFKAFERIEESRNRTIEGTGLGMSIVKKLLDLMGSTMIVESAYGAGSKFSFEIVQEVNDWSPLGDYKEAFEEAVEKEVDYSVAFVAPNAKILIVDDTEMNLFVVSGLLKNTKMQITTAKNGIDALEKMVNTEYDIMLIDQRMPEMDGMELIGRIRSNLDNPNYNKPCICLTANVVTGIREKCIEAGFDDYLEKPVDGKILEQTIAKYLPKDLMNNSASGYMGEAFSDGTIDETDSSVSYESVSNKEHKSDTNDKSSVIIAVDDVQDNVAGSETESDSSENGALKDLEDKGYIKIEDGISYAGSEELFIMTLQFFRDSIDSKSDEIEQLYLADNIEVYGAKVHALKSSARIIGATALSEEAKALEKAANDNDIEYIKANNMELLSHYRKYKNFLEGI